MNDTSSNDLFLIVAQAIEEIKDEQGTNFSVEKINLADLERRTGLSRSMNSRTPKSRNCFLFRNCSQNSRRKER